MTTDPIHENRSLGKLYPSEQIHIIAMLITAGHEVHEWTRSPANRLVAVFPVVAGDLSVHDTIRDYTNHKLPLDAKALIDMWMHLRDMTRNKRFAVGTSTPKDHRS